MNMPPVAMQNGDYGKIESSDVFDLLFNKNPNNIPDDAPIFIFEEKTTTYGELPDLIRKCAYNLQEKFGIQKGDVVAIRSLPHINYPLVMYGVLYSGATIAFVRQAPGDDFDSIFQEVEVVRPKLFIFGAEGSDISLEVAKKLDIPTSNLLAVDTEMIEGVDSVQNVLLSGKNLAEPCTYTPDEFENHPSYLLFTSGSTGKKKAVQVTNKTILYSLMFLTPPKNGFQRLFANKPFCYGTSNFNELIASIYTGTEVYISQVIEIDDICQAIEKHKITAYTAAPHIITRMTKEQVYKKYDLSSLTRLTSAGSAMTKPALELTKESFGVPVINLYGSSEIVTPFAPTPDLCAQGAIGFLLPGFIIKLVDEDGNEVESGQPGELLIKGPTITKGYYNNPEATAKAFSKDGFFCTGDILMHVGGGVYKFLSRSSHLMKYLTTRIFPHEIEKVVLTHPKVADCGVIGVFSHEQSTDLPRAYITLVDKEDYVNKEELEREILEYTNKQLPELKQIRAGVIIKETLPRTASDKIIYTILKQEAAAEQN